MTPEQRQHEIIQKIKEIISKTKRVPTPREIYLIPGCSSTKIWHLFGGIHGLYAAIGVNGPSEPSKKKQVKDIFEKQISQVIETHQNQVREQFKTDQKILLIPDTHFPFVDKESLKKIYQFAKDVKPTIIIQLGDLYDMFSQGKFPRSMNNYNPFEEIKLARQMAETMWDTLPKATRRYQLLGNHDMRPIKRVIESCPETEPFFNISEYFKFKNVETILDARQELYINDIAFIHGYRTKLGDHRDFMLKNVVHGHTHRGGVHFKKIGDKVLFELDCGYIGDPTSKALSYTAQKTTHWTHGFGYIDQYGPRFIAI